MIKPASLRARYRRWTEKGVPTPGLPENEAIEINRRAHAKWVRLLHDMANMLPVHTVNSCRLIPERPAHENFPEVVERYRADVEKGDLSDWLPLVVEGFPTVGDLQVVDGNHRTYALEGRNVAVRVVFARHILIRR